MTDIILTQYSGKIVGPVARLIGYIMNSLYMFLNDVFSVQNIALCIILFTVIIYFLLLPLTYKQQKFSRLQQEMQPEVNAISGEYNFPMYIEIVGDAEEVYYTTDGSDPTYTSNTYTGPIPMPLGKSHFKFARIVEGVTGTVAERNYRLVMNTDYTPEEAVTTLRTQLDRIIPAFWESELTEKST